jgi:cyanate permease
VPVACFAVVGWYAPALAHRFGEHRAVAAGLGLMTVGLATRALVDSGAAAAPAVGGRARPAGR